MLFIFFTVLIDLLGIGIVIPVLPYYVKILESSGDPWLVVNRALIVGGLSAIYALMQFICAPWLGSLSDRYGRRPVLLISLLGTGLGYVIFGFSQNLFAISPWLMLAALFASRIIDGVTGANISTAQAYIADITTPENRAKGLGMIGAAFGLGLHARAGLGGRAKHLRLSGAGVCSSHVIVHQRYLWLFCLARIITSRSSYYRGEQ
jgi:MFS family permease